MLKSPIRHLFIGNLLLILVVAAAAWLTFDHFSNKIESSSQHHLQVIAHSKKEQIETLLRERTQDGQLLASRPAVWQALAPEQPIHGKSYVPLQKVIEQTARTYGYRDIHVVDLQIHSRASLENRPLHPTEAVVLKEATIHPDSTQLADMHPCEDNRVCFGIITPVFQYGDPQLKRIGLIYLELDAQSRLFPILTQSPDKFSSTETLLIKPEGDKIAVLSPLRYLPETQPFEHKLPQDETGHLFVQTIRQTPPALINGMDYRGEHSIAATEHIAGTDWILLAKMDSTEIRQPLDQLRNYVVAAAALLSLLLSVGSILLWRWKHAESIARQLKSTERYKAALHASMDAFLAYDEKGKIHDVNEAMIRLTGYTRQELLHMAIGDINPTLTPEQLKHEIELIRLQGADHLRTRWRTKDARAIDVDISTSHPQQGEDGVFYSFVRDITEEIQSRHRIERLNSFYQFLSQTNEAIFKLHSVEAILDAVCKAAVEHGHFILAWAGLLDAAAERVLPVAAYGVATDYVKQLNITTDPALPTSHGPTRICMLDKRVVRTNDFQHDKNTVPWHHLSKEHNIGSSAAVPVIVNDQAIAALNFYATSKNYFDDELLDLMEETAQKVALALQTAEAERNRQEAEAARIASEELFNRAFDASPVPMQIESLSTRQMKYINKAHQQTFGYKLQEIADEQTWFQLAYPEAEIREQINMVWQNNLQDAQQNGPGHILRSPELRMRCKDGNYRTVLGYMSLIGDDIIVQWQDISEIKHKQAQLSENEQRFRSLIEQTIAGIYVTVSNRITYINPRMSEILGWSQEELLGHDSLEIYSHDESNRAQILDMRKRLNAGEKSVLLTLSVKRKDGIIITLGIHATLGIWDGEQALIVMAQDITEKQRAEERIAEYIHQLEGTMEGTLRAVAKMVDLRDPYTAGHERRVGLIAADIAREMGWPEDKCRNLQLIGLVHDIGKIAVPAEILSKPTRLTPLEYNLIKEHAEKGYEILKDVEFPLPIAEIIREHHERMDGSGYPQGLKGEQILPEARVLAVADVLESMASHRPYRPALGMDAAMQEIESHSGTWYDKPVVDALLRLIREKNYQVPS